MGSSVGWWDKIKVHVALVLAGAGYGGYYVLSKAALTGGVDPFLFSTYRDGIGCLTLFFYAVVFEREQWPKMTREVAGLIVAMAIVGVYLQQAFFLFGLQYTDVIFSAIIMNCVPVWAFLIAVIFGVEEISFGRRDGQAKVVGILLCFTGATILTLYKGPVVYGFASSPLPGVSSGDSAVQVWGIDTWRLGALCLLACSICVASFTNLQSPTLKRFPAPFTMMALNTLLGTALFATTAYFRVPDLSSWILPPGPDLIAAVYAGLFASGLGLFLSAWANHQSGPILVAAYNPLPPIFAALFGIIFLHSALFMGSLVGALGVIIGLFLVIWGTRESLLRKELSLEIPTHGNEHLENPKLASLLVEPLLG